MSGHGFPPLSAGAQSRCAPARCAGAGAERPVADREDANIPSRQLVRDGNAVAFSSETK